MQSLEEPYVPSAELARVHLRNAVTLYQGELLAGFYQDQILLHRREYAQKYRSVLEQTGVQGRYYIRVFPVFTADGDVGPNGERSVAAVISPVAKKRKGRQPR